MFALLDPDDLIAVFNELETQPWTRSFLTKRSIASNEGLTIGSADASAMETRKAPPGFREVDDFTQQQYDPLAFELDHHERDRDILKLSKNVRSFYQTLSRNISETRSWRSSFGNPSRMPTIPARHYVMGAKPKVRGILVVEDSKLQMKMIIRSLAVIGTIMDENWVFYEASTGEFALKIWEDLPIDLVFVDQNLSSNGIKGAEIIKIIRQATRTRKLLMVGVISNPQSTGTLASAGADLVYTKPLANQPAQLNSLIGAIRSLQL